MGEAIKDVKGFGSLSRADVEFAGGKGANLGELTAAGFPVPPGFVVGAPIYARFIDESGLRDRVAARLEGLDVNDSAALTSAARDARAMVDAQPVPEDIASAIVAAYESLVSDGGPVAVRSSATAEDTEAASFAGM